MEVAAALTVALLAVCGVSAALVLLDGGTWRRLVVGLNVFAAVAALLSLL